jgi:hypothetical protein
MMACMPTTLSGLFLFVVLLLPGFAYVVGRERHTSWQQQSAFRETAVVVAASVSVELVVLLAFAIFRTAWPGITPDVGALVRNSDAYLRGHDGRAGHYAQVTIWAVAMLAVSIALAYAAACPGPRRVVGRISRANPHESNSSAWWILFGEWADGTSVRVRCFLDDGSCVEGTLGSHSREADDKLERDLILVEPIGFRPDEGQEIKPYEASAVCVSATRIVSMFVTYLQKQAATSTAVSAAAEETGAASQGSSAAVVGQPPAVPS